MLINLLLLSIYLLLFSGRSILRGIKIKIKKRKKIEFTKNIEILN